jgi:hypothetical protein
MKNMKPIIKMMNTKIGINSKIRTGMILILLFVVVFIILVKCGAPSADYWPDIEAGFHNPPQSAKPRVWWHWMNGNVTKHGIKADLEWMNHTGIGGFQNFDASLATPQIVEKRLIYMTPEWKDAFLYTTRLADSLGLEMAIAGSPGWSESGGPWVPPSQAMKKYVWSEIRITGGQPFSGKLPQPPSTTGSFQNISGFRRGFGITADEPVPEFYADAAVIAFRIPENDLSMIDLQPEITSSGGQFDLRSLIDGDVAQSTLLPAAPAGEKSWIQFEFTDPVKIQAFTLVTGGATGRGYGSGGPSINALEASDNGKQFRTILEIPAGGAPQRTFTFPPETGKFFRFTVTAPSPQPGQGGGFPSFFPQESATPAGTQIAELKLHTVARINHFEEKAGFTSTPGLASVATPPAPATDVITKDNVIDLTSNMTTDGTLNWTPPEGEWIVIRLGYSLTGHQNSPASPEATGLEVDKLNAEFVKNYFNNYLDQYKDATGGLMGERGLQYIITDSWEAGVANWTDKIIEEFNTRNSYNILPWLPVLTGRIVESAEASDRFLWDFRNTLGKMVAEYHYDVLTEILHERDMGRYTESHENGRAFIGDGMEIKRNADIPMSATWATRTPGQIRGDQSVDVAVRHKADVRESASVAHLYGQNLVAAESMTARGNTWGFSPEWLKPTADMEMASGLNLFVIHTSVHQPVDDKIPGLGLGPFGQWFTRHETWGEQALPWTTYLARSCFLLQQGHFVADAVYLYGEDNNITALFGRELPEIPKGYEFDFTNADALVNLLSVKKGQIVTPGGMSYRLLALDSSTQYMSLPVLRKIREMVNEGAVVVGPKPINTSSLNDDVNEFMTIAGELWGEVKGIQSAGKGKVYTGYTIAEVIEDLQIEPDFEYTRPHDNTELLYVHRRLSDGEIYWVNNRTRHVENLEATFRVDGKATEIWNPVSGEIKPASYTIADGRTSVPLHLEPDDAVFVVFRKKAESSSQIIPVTVETRLATIEGPWKVTFQPDRGAPEQIILDDLEPWNENSDPGVKYFSGSGTYSNTIQAPAEWFESGKELWLDLGDVKNLAEVVINNQPLGIVWKTPFRVNATEALREGENSIEVKVTNLWVNRLIGDQQPGVTDPVTYTTQAFYQADSPLLPSGLMGPVNVVSLSTD